MAFRLTDDEIAALAADQGGAWFAPLPTINDSDAAELMRAVLRGRRSIAVRNSVFVDTGGTARTVAEVRSVIAPAVGTPPRLTAYVADEENPEMLAGLSLSVFPAADATERTVVLTTSGGVNEVSLRLRDEAEELVRGFADDIQATGEGSRVLTVVCPRRDGATTVTVVGRGVVTTRTYAAGVYGPPVTAAGLPDALHELV